MRSHFDLPLHLELDRSSSRNYCCLWHYTPDNPCGYRPYQRLHVTERLYMGLKAGEESPLPMLGKILGSG